MIFKNNNLPSLSGLLINETSLFNRKTKNIDDIESDYITNELPNHFSQIINDYESIIKNGSISYEFEKSNNKILNVILNLEFQELNINIPYLNNFINRNDNIINKIRFHFNGKHLVFINFIEKEISKSKNLDLEFINNTPNPLNIYFYNKENSKNTNIFNSNNKITITDLTNKSNLYFDNKKQDLFNDKNSFIESFLTNLLGKSDNLKIGIGNYINFNIYNSGRFIENFWNDNTDYDKIIKEITKGKYEWKINNNALDIKFKYFGFPGGNGLSFSLKRVK